MGLKGRPENEGRFCKRKLTLSTVFAWIFSSDFKFGRISHISKAS